MKSIKLNFIWIAMSFLSITACKKNVEEKKENQSPQTFSDYLGNKISRDFIGNVMDENKNPIKNVSVSIDNATTITDSNGDFKIKNANVNVNFAYIEAKKEGYRNNAISMVPRDSINEVKLVLLKESELCLFWFCKHNHSLPNSSN